MRIYLIFMLACFMGGMVLSAKAEEKEPLIIEMLNKRDKEKMLYGQDVARVEVGQTVTVSYTHLTLPTNREV